MNIRARLDKLVAARAAWAAAVLTRPPLMGTAKHARIAALMAFADPLAPATPRQRRALRVAALLQRADARASVCPH